ncbi:MAG: hypothetical protein AAF907_04365, partial [Planctomycetota bacterium]
KDYSDPDVPTGEDEPPAFHPQLTAVIRLRAARRLLESPGGRSKAAALMGPIDAARLPPKHRKMLEKLTAMANG